MKYQICFLLLSLSLTSGAELEAAEERCEINYDSLDIAAKMNRNFMVNARWPNGVVPYQIASTYTAQERNVVMQALQMISSQTCVRFVERTGQSNYVDIINNGNGCFANLGYNGNRGRHVLHLQKTINGRTCMIVGIAAHEMLHILGFAHEQTRPDRDSFVRINWGNIPTSVAHNFFRALGPNDASIPVCNSNSGASTFDNCYSGFRAETFGQAYDYQSVMHYGATAFSTNGQPTIVALQSGVTTLGQRSGLTALDFAKVNAAYSCSGGVTTPSTSSISTTSTTSTTTTRPSSNCRDRFSNCGAYARFCQYPFLQRNCPLTCGRCDQTACADRSPACERYARYCRYGSVRRYCPQTCGACPQ